MNTGNLGLTVVAQLSVLTQPSAKTMHNETWPVWASNETAEWIIEVPRGPTTRLFTPGGPSLILATFTQPWSQLVFVLVFICALFAICLISSILALVLLCIFKRFCLASVKQPDYAKVTQQPKVFDVKSLDNGSENIYVDIDSKSPDSRSEITGKCWVTSLEDETEAKPLNEYTSLSSMPWIVSSQPVTTTTTVIHSNGLPLTSTDRYKSCITINTLNLSHDPLQECYYSYSQVLQELKDKLSQKSIKK